MQSGFHCDTFTVTVPLLSWLQTKHHVSLSLPLQQAEGDSDHSSDSGQPEAGPERGRGGRRSAAAARNHHQSLNPNPPRSGYVFSPAVQSGCVHTEHLFVSTTLLP